MPSWTDDAVVLFGDASYDTEQFGIPAPITGLALSSINFNPSRTIETITGHYADEILHIGKTPVFEAEVTGKSLLTAGPLNNVAPFTPISRAVFGNYTAYTQHGMPDTGSFLVTSVRNNAPAGTFRDTTVTLKLVTTFNQIVSPATAA